MPISINAIPTETVIRHSPTGELQAASVKFLLPDSTNETPPIGFQDAATSEVLQAVLGATLVEALAQVEELQAQADSVPSLESQIATLQSEKAALQSQLDAILNPPSSPVDWVGFRTAIAVNPSYLRIASHSLTTTVLDSKLTWVLGAGEFGEVPALWNAIAALATPTTEEIAALNTLAETYGVPFQLDSQGLMPT